MLSVQIEHKLPQFTLDINFEVNNDEIAVLFGPSGSGKTTILNGISGLIKLKNGSICLNNRHLLNTGKSVVPVQKKDWLCLSGLCIISAPYHLGKYKVRHAK